MTMGRRLVRMGLVGIDELYQRVHDLRPVGPLFYVGIKVHRGATIALADGTRIETGAPIGRLHINNARAAAVQASGRLQAGVRFARLLIESLAELAARAHGDPRYGNIELYEGVTWFRPHGSTVGFHTEPVQSGPRRRWLARHFRLLIWSFAPAAHAAAMTEVDPRLFRITRRALIENFARAGRASGL